MAEKPITPRKAHKKKLEEAAQEAYEKLRDDQKEKLDITVLRDRIIVKKSPTEHDA